MNEKEVLEYLRKHTLTIGDFTIRYKGEVIDTITGRNEGWIVIHKLPLFKEDEEDEDDDSNR